MTDIKSFTITLREPYGIPFLCTAKEYAVMHTLNLNGIIGILLIKDCDQVLLLEEEVSQGITYLVSDVAVTHKDRQLIHCHKSVILRDIRNIPHGTPLPYYYRGLGVPHQNLEHPVGQSSG